MYTPDGQRRITSLKDAVISRLVFVFKGEPRSQVATKGREGGVVGCFYFLKILTSVLPLVRRSTVDTCIERGTMLRRLILMLLPNVVQYSCKGSLRVFSAYLLDPCSLPLGSCLRVRVSASGKSVSASFCQFVKKAPKLHTFVFSTLSLYFTLCQAATSSGQEWRSGTCRRCMDWRRLARST